MDTVKEQLYRLSQSGAHTIKFVDRTFNCNVGRAFELFEYIIGLDTPCSFHFEVAADLFDARTLSLLSDAPPARIQLEAGLQSFFEPALNAVSRQSDLIKAEQNIRKLLHGRNIHVHVDLIAGLPFETLSGFQGSFDRAYSLGAHTLQLGFLKLLHGSALRCEAESLGIIYDKDPPYQIRSSPWLGVEDMEVLKQTENALQHTHNKCRFLSALEYVLSASGMRPFMLFHKLGASAPNHGTDLTAYAASIYELCTQLPGVDRSVLRDHMIYDWLCMVKGKNMPGFMKEAGGRSGSRRAAFSHQNVPKTAKMRLGREISRNEAAVLGSGMGVFVDSNSRDPVTRLYALHFV